MYHQWHPQVLSDFEDDMPKYWGRKWKANTTIGKLRMILLHRPGPEFLNVGTPTPWPPHGDSLAAWRMTFKPDMDELIRHHENLAQAYKEEGVEVLIRKPDPYDPPTRMMSATLQSMARSYYACTTTSGKAKNYLHTRHWQR